MRIAKTNNNYNSSFQALYLRNSGNWGLSRKIKFRNNTEVQKLIRLFREQEMDLEAKIADSSEQEIEIHAINNKNIISNGFVCKIESLSNFSAQKALDDFYKNQSIVKVLKCLLNRTTT